MEIQALLKMKDSIGNVTSGQQAEKPLSFYVAKNDTNEVDCENEYDNQGLYEQLGIGAAFRCSGPEVITIIAATLTTSL